MKIAVPENIKKVPELLDEYLRIMERIEEIRQQMWDETNAMLNDLLATTSLRKVAKMLGCSHTYISFVHRRQDTPSLEMYQKLKKLHADLFPEAGATT